MVVVEGRLEAFDHTAKLETSSAYYQSAAALSRSAAGGSTLDAGLLGEARSA